MFGELGGDVWQQMRPSTVSTPGTLKLATPLLIEIILSQTAHELGPRLTTKGRSDSWNG